MPKRTTFFFLSLVKLFLVSGPLTANPTLIIASVTHESTPTTLLQDTAYDCAIKFANRAEKNAIKTAFAFPKTQTAALALKNTFVTTFLHTTKTWTKEIAQGSTPTTTKMLAVYDPSTANTKKIAFIMRLVFKKQPNGNSITVTATIMSDTSYASSYVKNLVKTAFSTEEASSQSTLGAVSLGGIMLLGCTLLQNTEAPPPDPKRRETPKQPDPAPQHFFAQCEERLAKIAELAQPGIITLTKASTSPTSLRFSTSIDEDEKRHWGRTLNFTLRETRPEDRHPTHYVLHDDKYGKPNKLIYKINTVDDFTTTMLTHLLVRKVEIGLALEHFEAAINTCDFKDAHVMTQFYKHNDADGTLEEALGAYIALGSLGLFFENHHN